MKLLDKDREVNIYGKLYLLSDHHWFHKNIIEYSNRPFSGVDEMNREMTGRWNEVVGPDDTMLHIGDIAMGKRAYLPKVVENLSGYKILIKGNHDRSDKQMLDAGFDEVYKELTIVTSGGKRIMVRHKPQDADKLIGYSFQFHGHTHSDIKMNGKYINFSVEAWDYYPVDIDNVFKMIGI